MNKALLVFLILVVSFKIQCQTTLYNFPFEGNNNPATGYYLPTAPVFTYGSGSALDLSYPSIGVSTSCGNAMNTQSLETTKWDNADYLQFSSSTLGASGLAFKFCHKKNNTQNFGSLRVQISLTGTTNDWLDLDNGFFPADLFNAYTNFYAITSTYENKSTVFIRILKTGDPQSNGAGLLVDNVSLVANCATPYLQTTGIGITNGPGTSLNINCTRGNGGQLMVVARAGAAVNVNPTNGTSYNVGNVIGTENYVVYKGSANNFNIASFNGNQLNSGTTYHFAFYEYNPNANNSCPRYLTPATTASQQALPIELTTFTANPVPTGIALKWSTASEINNAYVAVERSTDGNRYDEIGRVPGQGDSFEQRDYNYTDENPEKGVNYYRLRQVDYDGSENFSPVVQATFGKTGKLGVYPSPATERLNVTLKETDGEPVRWEVYDVSGRLVKSGTEEADIPEFPVELAGLPEGVYTLQVFVGREVMMERFVKK